MTKAATLRETEQAFPRTAWQWGETQPDRVAATTARGDTTYGQLTGRANQLTNALRALGIGRGDAFMGVLHNGIEHWELLLAATQMGAYYVAANWHLSVDNLLYLIEDSGTLAVFVDVEFTAQFDSKVAELPAHRFVVNGTAEGWQPYDDFGRGHSRDLPTDRTLGSIMAYTSGTTGRPKGVRSEITDLSPEVGIAAYDFLLDNFHIPRGDGRHLVCSPQYHAAPGGFAFALLNNGHRLVIHQRFDPESTLEAIERFRITTSHMVPTHFHRMLQLSESVRAQYDLSSLEMIAHAGAACPPEIKREMLEWFGPIIWEYLGASEGMASIMPPHDALQHPGSVGKPFASGSVKILDDDGEELPVGDEGLIYFQSDVEYYRDPTKTAAARKGAYLTVGDYGKFDGEGYLYILDRRIDLIVSGGVNVYPAEVESALIMHPKVQDVGVIGIPDPEWGKRVCAVIELVPGVDPTDELRLELAAWAKVNISTHMRPKQWEFLHEFPRTPAGKLIRRALRDMFSTDSVAVI